jgi:hypothetical protein
MLLETALEVCSSFVSRDGGDTGVKECVVSASLACKQSADWYSEEPEVTKFTTG